MSLQGVLITIFCLILVMMPLFLMIAESINVFHYKLQLISAVESTVFSAIAQVQTKPFSEGKIVLGEKSLTNIRKSLMSRYPIKIHQLYFKNNKIMLKGNCLYQGPFGREKVLHIQTSYQLIKM